MFVTLCAVTSAAVVVYVAVHVVVASGATGPASQSNATPPAILSSDTWIADTGTLPVFFTVYVYVIVSSDAAYVVGDADFESSSPGAAI